MADVLLLEADASIRELVMTVLTRAGHTVTGTGGGDEAIRATQTGPFDALIVDVSIYGSVLEDGARRGLGFLHYLQRTQPAALERVIVTSALPDGELRHELPPVYRLIRKPFDIDELTKAISECLTSRRQRHRQYAQDQPP